MASTFEQLCINTLRFLAVDAVEKANSGHPGAPMGAAPLAYVLWQKHLVHNPVNPKWIDRDRFILSAGHASMLLYALLYLNGYDLTLDDLKQFRQWGSKTPGHPEYGITPGVEATTGPLGQGFTNATGMAIAERHLAARYNRPGFDVINHYTWVICSDGDLMEGVSAESASMAGHLKLGKLICLYDDNNISIEGSTNITFTEDVGQRFRAYGWQVIGPIDGMSTEAVDEAINQARLDIEHPSLIICRTIIGYGSPHKANSGTAHGEPLGKDETVLSKANLDWNYTEAFTVPQDVLQHFRQAVAKGQQREAEWHDLWDKYQKTYPSEARELEMSLKGELPAGWDAALADLFRLIDKPMATREASGMVLNAIAPLVPALIGGSADLSPSTKTIIKDGGDFNPGNYAGRNLHFGIREHAMGAMANGMALHGGIIPYTATFLVFYDYMRPAVRLAALMEQRVIYIFTHDSVGLGEDGPTHQPVEQLAGLRSVPNLSVIRPADATETAEAWQLALKRRRGSTALILTRQGVPILDRSVLSSAEGVRRGGYTLWQATDQPDVIFIATGSEVHIALEAGQILKSRNISTRVVSMPSWDIFDSQPEQYRLDVLPTNIKNRISIEAGITLGWQKYTGDTGINIGINHFGASAPGKTLYEKFGFTAQRLVDEAINLLAFKPAC
jgi:transketolase